MIIKILISCLIIIILITIILLMFLSSKSRFQIFNIKMKEADSSIKLFLQKKAVDLDKIIKEITNKGSDEGKFKNFTKDVDSEKDSYKLHSLLSKYYAFAIKILFDNDYLAKDKKIIEYLNELKVNEENLIGSIKFYNDTVVDYNGLLNSFPHSLFSKVLGYEEKEFYDNEKEELFDILKK